MLQACSVDKEDSSLGNEYGCFCLLDRSFCFLEILQDDVVVFTIY